MIEVQEQTAIRTEDFERAPCLREGPISSAARSVVTAARRLGKSYQASQLRSRCVVYLFENSERIFASGEEPNAAFNVMLKNLTQMLNEAVDNNFGSEWRAAGNGSQSRGNDGASKGDIREITGNHYGRLFRDFSATSFWDEPVRLLRTRIERNQISTANLKQKRVLDAGCGGGRYAVAWRLLGAGNVVGLDGSEIAITDARKRITEAKTDAVEFEHGDVLDLPFADNSFDIVFSNGVLHHTTDWRRGVNELLRVLKPGGFGWLYLIENTGGLFWDLVEILRVVMEDEDRNNARNVLNSIGVPANRIFYMLDHVMVPINLRLTCSEIEQQLAAAGAINTRRLTRGADFDRVERIYQKDPFAELKYGVGENRYTFSKQ